MDVKEVVDAAAIALAQAFPGKTVYAERIEQGFERPCFFLSATEEEAPLMNDRARCCLHLRVAYHGEKGSRQREETAAVGAELSLALEWLEVNGLPRRAQAMGYQSEEEGSLTWTAEYCGHVFKRRELEKMRSLGKKIRMRDGKG